MVTTIQVTSQIKDKLFRLKLKISELEGRNVSYNEIIHRLLQNSESTIKPPIKNRLAMRKYRGSLPKNTLKEWQEEKYKDFS
ncbi:MAG: hypothetical protein ACTSVZ_03510 [Promethearchaeota archaeon]